jgi:hypothetical protein
LYRLLVQRLSVHCCHLQSLHCLSVPHTVPFVGSVSFCPMLPSRVCPPSVSTTHFTICWFCVSLTNAFFYSLSTVCQYITLYRQQVPNDYVHCCLPKPVHCVLVTHIIPSVGSV